MGLRWEQIDARTPWILVSADRAGFHGHCTACGQEIGPTSADGLDAFSSQHTDHRSSSGMGLGDLVRAGTQAMGIKPCAPCERRRQQMNNFLPGFPGFRRRP